MGTPWQPNFRLNYWLCLLLALVGVAAAIYGIAKVKYFWFAGGTVIALLALLTTRLHGKAKVPIPGMRSPLEGDFSPIGDPPPEGERVTVVDPEESERPSESAPPPE
jgi:hypothetical protein